MSKKSIELVQYKMVLPKGLHSRLDREAKRNRRSLSSEITERLERSFTISSDQSDQSDEKMRALAWQAAHDVILQLSDPDKLEARNAIKEKQSEGTQP